MNHLGIEERKWMIGFTNSEVELFFVKITEQNETFIIARKTHWKIPQTINKLKLKNGNQKCEHN